MYKGQQKKQENSKPKQTAKQKKMEKIAAKKAKQEEMKHIMKGLQDMRKQVPETMYSQMESFKNIVDHKRKSDIPLDESKIRKEDKEMQDNESDAENDGKISEEEKEEENKPINIFSMKFFENKKVKKEEEKKGPTDQEKLAYTLDLRQKVIEEEMEANFAINPFKAGKNKQGDGDEDPNAEDEKEAKVNEQHIVDQELAIFIQEMSAQFNQRIERTEEQTKDREKLPITLREHDIVEAINNNLITIISGETGSGKSTQVPQYLYERGYGHKDGPNPGKIGITQPRRIAAIALAKRVSEEMGTKLGDKVAYQVRHESSSLNENNKVKFMTDGILMREIMSDFLLEDYSCIVIDEAHERKVNTDILIGFLSRVVNMRLRLAKEERNTNPDQQPNQYRYHPLRIVIMSATLRVSDFTKNKYLFPKPVCVINVEARQFPLTVLFSKVTKEDYFEEGIKKTIKIHSKLPPGGILVFMTGEREIRQFCRALQERLQKYKDRQEDEEINKKIDAENGNEDDDDDDDGRLNRMKMLDLDDVSDNEDEEPLVAQENPQDQESQIQQYKDMKNNKDIPKLKPYIVPLYSKLPMHEQERIFSKITDKERLIVVSTNVAETSLTIPGIKYVVDSGKEKVKIYDDKLSISHYNIEWASKASSDQRAGRAARVGPGYCYRLYSRAVYGNVFQQFKAPEITNMPLENIVLQLKAIGINDVLKFPYPTAPNLSSITLALKNLLKLQALEFNKNQKIQNEEETEEFKQSDNYAKFSGEHDNTCVTDLGKALSFIPISPKFAKAVLMGRSMDVFAYTMLIAAGLSVEEIFSKEVQLMDEPQQEEENYDISENQQNTQIQIKQGFQQKYGKFIVGNSDLFTVMNILGDFMKFLYKRCPTLDDIPSIESAILDYSNLNSLLSKSLKAIFLNLRQLIQIFETLIDDADEKAVLINSFKNYVNPTAPQMGKLQEVITSISTAKVARKVKKNVKKVKTEYAYEILDHDMEIYIHPHSCLKSTSPEFVVYDEVILTSKYYMRNVTKVNNLHWLLKYDESDAPKNIKYLTDPKPFYSAKKQEVIVFAESSFGKKGWNLPCFEYRFQEQDERKKFIWFTRSLLDGVVVQNFKSLTKFYAMPVDSIKEWSTSPRADSIINKLSNAGIDDHVKLFAKWAVNKNFLLEEICGFCKPEYKEKIVKVWPALTKKP